MYTENQLTRPVRRRLARGFTLIELLLVLVILAVLAAVVVPKFTARSEQARQTAAKTDISALELALDAFEVDCGRYPTNQEGLGILMEPAGAVPNSHGPYIKRTPNDPWGNPYVYRCPGTHNASGYDLFSMGAEAREGPNNITNWDK